MYTYKYDIVIETIDTINTIETVDTKSNYPE